MQQIVFYGWITQLIFDIARCILNRADDDLDLFVFIFKVSHLRLLFIQ